MSALGKRVAVASLIAATAFAPVSASAQTTPTLNCRTRPLIVGAAEVNAVHVACAVSGAPGGDVWLRIVSGQSRTICQAGLAAGTGQCGGLVFGSPEVDGLIAVLMPSGTRFSVLDQAGIGGEASPPLQYTPLPEDTGASDADTPAPEAPAD